MIDTCSGVHPDSDVGIAFRDCVTASFPESDIDAPAFWSAGAFWASNGKHNKRTSRERAKIFITAKSTPDCSMALLDRAKFLFIGCTDSQLILMEKCPTI